MKRKRRKSRGKRALHPQTVQLVRDAQGGNQEALDGLCHRYLPRVRRIVALRTGRKLRSLHEEEDLVQLAMMRVLTGLRNYRERSEASFRSWVSRCVENELIDLRRRADAQKHGGNPKAPLGLQAEEEIARRKGVRQATPSELVRADELSERIEDALLALPPQLRELIVLRHLCGMSCREIAAELGFQSEVSARVALSRARGRLAALIPK